MKTQEFETATARLKTAKDWRLLAWDLQDILSKEQIQYCLNKQETASDYCDFNWLLEDTLTKKQKKYIENKIKELSNN